MAPASNMPPGFRPSPTKAGQSPSSGGERYVLQAGFALSPPQSQGQRGSGGMPPGFIPSPPQSQTQVISPQGLQQNVQAWSLHPPLKPSEPPSYVAGGTLNSAANPNQVAYGPSGSILGPNDGWQPVGGGAPYVTSPPPQAVVSPSSYGGPVGGGAPHVMSPPPQLVVSPSSYGGYNGYSGPVQAAPPPITQQSPIGVPPHQLYSAPAASPPPIQPPGQNGGPPRAPTLVMRNSGPQQSLTSTGMTANSVSTVGVSGARGKAAPFPADFVNTEEVFGPYPQWDFNNAAPPGFSEVKQPDVTTVPNLARSPTKHYLPPGERQKAPAQELEYDRAGPHQPHMNMLSPRKQLIQDQLMHPQHQHEIVPQPQFMASFSPTGIQQFPPSMPTSLPMSPMGGLHHGQRKMTLVGAELASPTGYPVGMPMSPAKGSPGNLLVPISPQGVNVPVVQGGTVRALDENHVVLPTGDIVALPPGGEGIVTMPTGELISLKPRRSPSPSKSLNPSLSNFDPPAPQRPPTPPPPAPAPPPPAPPPAPSPPPSPPPQAPAPAPVPPAPPSPRMASPRQSNYTGPQRANIPTMRIIGVGLQLERDSLDYNRTRVIEIVPGLAAAESGLFRIGDILTEVDGKEVDGVDMFYVKQMILGTEGSSVHLVATRGPGGQRIECNLTRKYPDYDFH